ncbi:MAG: transketolase C-terminal domain-containing protein, partial [Candidatus Caldarchaeum sp.]
TQVFGDTLLALAKDDPKIIAITAAMPDGTGLAEFAKILPKQYVDVGIAEEHAVTFAGGLAAGGLKPACAIYSTFLQRAFDQILHDIGIQNLPVRFFLDRAGLVGADGATHHGVFDIGYLSLIPNMVLMAPRDPAELAEMVRFAMAYEKGPIAVRYPRGSAEGSLPIKQMPIELGKAEILESGEDIALVGYGSTVSLCFQAAKTLKSMGISSTIVNARFAKPLDKKTLTFAAMRCGALVTVEEHVLTGGFGEAVLRMLREENALPEKFATIALPDRFLEHGSQEELRKEAGLTLENVVQTAESLLKKDSATPIRSRRA